jgi:hypothetical protein
MIRCTKFVPLERGALLGFADLEFGSGLVLHDCQVLQKDGRRWIGLPSKPQLDASKNVVRNEAGKVVMRIPCAWPAGGGSA